MEHNKTIANYNNSNLTPSVISQNKVTTVEQVVKSSSLSISSFLKNGKGETLKANLVLLITDLCLGFNIGKNITTQQVRGLVDDIINSEYRVYKLEDFKLCFQRGKTARYGKAFDRLDVQILFEWLKAYDIERNEEIEALRIKECQQKKEEMKTFAPEVMEVLLKARLEIEAMQNEKKEEKKYEMSETDKMVNRWMRHFDKLMKIREFKGEGAAFRFIRFKGKPMSIDEYLEHKIVQYNRVTEQLNNI